MKLKSITINHNGQILKMNLLVPLSLSSVEKVILEAQIEIAQNRERLKTYEEELRKCSKK